MIRAAAKNHADVAVIVDVADYDALLAEMAAQRRRHDGGLPPRDGAKGVRAHRRLRCGDLQLARPRDRRDAAGLARVRRQAGLGAALRREPASERGFLRRRRTPAPASPRRGRCRARRSPTTTSTTPTRLTNASPSSPSPPSPSSSTPTPAASPSARRCRRPTRRRSPATPSPRSAASSRSTGGSTPTRRERSSRFSPRSSSRPTPTPRRSKSSRREEEPAAAAGGRPAGSRTRRA